MFCQPIILCLLNYITETFQVTKGCKFFPQGMHVCHNERVSQDISQQTNKQISVCVCVCIYIYTHTHTHKYGTLFGLPWSLKNGVLVY
jgi:hypothetical protein